ERTMADARMSVVSWPEEFGGRDCGLVNWVVFEEEYFRADAPLRVSQNGIFLLAPTRFDHASPEQLERIMPRLARAVGIWARACSAPDAAPGLASLRSTARRVGAGWVLNVQQVWSTRASCADKGVGLSRTDPDEPRHKGLT